MTTLMQANSNWSSRPSDQRYQSFDDMMTVMEQRKHESKEFNMNPSNVSFIAEDNSLKLLSKNGNTASLTNYAFQTLCTRLGVPYGLLAEKLKASTVAAVLNDRHSGLTENTRVLFQTAQNGERTIRAFSTESYSRVMDADLLAIYKPLLDNGWYQPIAFQNGEPDSAVFTATADDVGKYGGNGGVQVKVGDKVVPSGLYSSDRDMFMMLINKGNNEDDGFGRPLFNGIMVSHSEVYNRTFNQLNFAMDGVCLNNICWGVKNINEVNMRHVGNANMRIMAAARETVQNLLRSTTVNFQVLRDTIKKARAMSLGRYEEDIINDIYKLKIDPVVTKNVLQRSLDLAEEFRDMNGNPHSVYGLFDGMTRLSQTFKYVEDREALDMAAGKILSLAR